MQKMIILTGVPGSGKSTLRKCLLQANPDWVYVCQDEIGSRDGCIDLVHKYLKENKTIIIDRTNINRFQRNHWIKLAKSYKIRQVINYYTKCNPELAVKRILARKDHSTITPDMSREKVTQIVRRFLKELQEPELSEGLSEVIIYNTNLSHIGQYIREANQNHGYRQWNSIFKSILSTTSKFFRR